MYNNYYYLYPCQSYQYTPVYQTHNMHHGYHTAHTQYPYWDKQTVYDANQMIKMKDYGPYPYVVNIEQATTQNNTFRTTLWTGKNLQVTLMSIKPGEDIGLEIHNTVDQFIRVEEGQGLVMIGERKEKLDYQKRVYDDFAIMIPAGKYHNIINTGNTPLKLYSIYAPPEHPRGTVHITKADAMAAEKNY
jgi:mannose-6-phosphate isomerase-like protein (cupin superfamily)